VEEMVTGVEIEMVVEAMAVEEEADLAVVVDVEEDPPLTPEGGVLHMRGEGEEEGADHLEIERDLLPLTGSVVGLQQ